MTTVYSEQIKGDRRNYHWSIRCDVTDGKYLGITQDHPIGGLLERVLLSPTQVDEIIRFYREQRRKKVAGKRA